MCVWGNAVKGFLWDGLFVNDDDKEEEGTAHAPCRLTKLYTAAETAHTRTGSSAMSFATCTTAPIDPRATSALLCSVGERRRQSETSFVASEKLESVSVLGRHQMAHHLDTHTQDVTSMCSRTATLIQEQAFDRMGLNPGH